MCASKHNNSMTASAAWGLAGCEHQQTRQGVKNTYLYCMTPMKGGFISTFGCKKHGGNPIEHSGSLQHQIDISLTAGKLMMVSSSLVKSQAQSNDYRDANLGACVVTVERFFYFFCNKSSVGHCRHLGYMRFHQPGERERERERER